ncbi:MAG: hypothetical protein ACYC4K_01210 [Thiobacillus sp.]
MNLARAASVSVREAMKSLVPETGSVLTPQLTYRIKHDTVRRLKALGYDIDARKIKLQFINGQPNLIMPAAMLNPVLH